MLANRLLREAGRTIGEVLASAVSLLNPSVIVIGGTIAEAGDPLLAGVREVVYRRSLPLATAQLRIVQASAGDLSGVVGAAVMVIDHVLAPAAVDRYVALTVTPTRQRVGHDGRGMFGFGGTGLWLTAGSAGRGRGRPASGTSGIGDDAAGGGVGSRHRARGLPVRAAISTPRGLSGQSATGAQRPSSSRISMRSRLS